MCACACAVLCMRVYACLRERISVQYSVSECTVCGCVYTPMIHVCTALIECKLVRPRLAGHNCVCVYVCVCVFVCIVYVCMCVCMCVCVFVCLCVYVCMFVRCC